jgi:hypothetical protein
VMVVNVTPETMFRQSPASRQARTLAASASLYPDQNPVIVNTSVTFDVPVLGIIYKDPADPYGNPSLPFYPLFTASDFLGAPGTSYQLEGAKACGPFCAFELTGDLDTASFLAKRRSSIITIRPLATLRASSLPIPHQFPAPSPVLASPASSSRAAFSAGGDGVSGLLEQSKRPARYATGRPLAHHRRAAPS